MNPNYLAGLTPQQRLLQQRAIAKSQRIYEETGKVVDRPKVSSKPTPRSPHAKRFEERYGYSISDIDRVKREFPNVDVDGILAKGRAAYASSGSRPNTTAEAWARARLASALTGGKAAKIDAKELGKK
jgi:hypothetical protein